jgi:hypothetical protein
VIPVTVERTGDLCQPSSVEGISAQEHPPRVHKQLESRVYLVEYLIQHSIQSIQRMAYQDEALA